MTKNVDMTNGPYLKKMVQYATPVMIGYVFQQLYVLTDSFIVSIFVDADAFAALGIASTILNFFNFITIGLCTGTAVLFAFYWGAHDLQQFKRVKFTSALLGCSFTLLIAIAGVLIMKPLLRFIQTPDYLITQAYTYIVVTLIGLVFVYIYNWFLGLFRAIGNSHIALYFFVGTMVLNIINDFIFILILHQGILGAALATITAQLVVSVSCYYYLRRQYPDVTCERTDMVLDFNLMKTITSYSLSASMQQFTLHIGKLMIQMMVNSIGGVFIIAHAAITKIETFVLLSASCGENTLNVFVSQNNGAQKKQRIKEGFWVGYKFILCLGIIVSVFTFLFADNITALLFGASEVETIAFVHSYFKMITVFYILEFSCNCFAGYFRGIGKVIVPFIGTTLQIIIRVILFYFFLPTLHMSGLALATGIGWIGILIYQLYCIKKYQTNLFKK